MQFEHEWNQERSIQDSGFGNRIVAAIHDSVFELVTTQCHFSWACPYTLPCTYLIA